MTLQFSDEQLTAFIDGEKQHTPYQDIEQALRTDPALQQRLQELEIDKQTISQSMDALLSIAPTPPKPPMEVSDTGSSSGIKGFLLASCAAGLMLFGGIIGYNISGKQVDSWQEYVAAYHYLYVTNTLVDVDRQIPEAVAELNKISGAIGKDFELERLESFSGLDYKRAQILGFEGRPLAQLTFLSKIGDPIALCIMRSVEDNADGISRQTIENMASASWSKSGYDFFIIGGKDQTLIDEAAEHFFANI